MTFIGLDLDSLVDLIIVKKSARYFLVPSYYVDILAPPEHPNCLCIMTPLDNCSLRKFNYSIWEI